ncbi:MAG: hypothetical protein ABSG53_15020, partial [Thermoguttaceae bacterium]
MKRHSPPSWIDNRLLFHVPHNPSVSHEQVSARGKCSVCLWGDNDWTAISERLTAIQGLGKLLFSNSIDSPGEHRLNEYKITFSNGEVVEIEAWTPEA